MRRRQPRRLGDTAPTGPTDIHDWVLGLPWVVERHERSDLPGVRSFAVDCAPLRRQRIWLVTGLDQQPEPGPPSIAIVLPLEAAWAIEDQGAGQCRTAMPGGYALVNVEPHTIAAPQLAEQVLLDAYCHAMA